MTASTGKGLNVEKLTLFPLQAHNNDPEDRGWTRVIHRQVLSRALIRI